MSPSGSGRGSWPSSRTISRMGPRALLRSRDESALSTRDSRLEKSSAPVTVCYCSLYPTPTVLWTVTVSVLSGRGSAVAAGGRRARRGIFYLLTVGPLYLIMILYSYVFHGSWLWGVGTWVTVGWVTLDTIIANSAPWGDSGASLGIKNRVTPGLRNRESRLWPGPESRIKNHSQKICFARCARESPCKGKFLQ